MYVILNDEIVLIDVGVDGLTVRLLVGLLKLK
jgi:hypothetical protein